VGVWARAASWGARPTRVGQDLAVFADDADPDFVCGPLDAEHQHHTRRRLKTPAEPESVAVH